MTNAGTHETEARSSGELEDVVFPPEHLDLVVDLTRFLEHHSGAALLVGPDGEKVELPDEVYQVLTQVAARMREGKAITIAPRSLLLTTQEAADFLGVSRPTLVKLLESGEIPFERPNRHRRVRLSALIEFHERRHSDNRSRLRALTRDAQELGIYEGSREQYADALKAARRRRARDTAS